MMSANLLIHLALVFSIVLMGRVALYFMMAEKPRKQTLEILLAQSVLFLMFLYLFNKWNFISVNAERYVYVLWFLSGSQFFFWRYYRYPFYSDAFSREIRTAMERKNSRPAAALAAGFKTLQIKPENVLIRLFKNAMFGVFAALVFTFLSPCASLCSHKTEPGIWETFWISIRLFPLLIAPLALIQFGGIRKIEMQRDCILLKRRLDWRTRKVEYQQITFAKYLPGTWVSHLVVCVGRGDYFFWLKVPPLNEDDFNRIIDILIELDLMAPDEN